MKRRMLILVALMVMTAVPAAAQAPGETPFPSPKVVGAFVRVQTVTSVESGYLTNFFPAGSAVVFEMYVGENKTGRTMTDKDLRYAKILIPGQPDVKMKYTNARPQWPWQGTWTVPADFKPGTIVGFQATIKTKSNRYGSFVQIPVSSSQLTVTAAG